MLPRLLRCTWLLILLLLLAACGDDETPTPTPAAMASNPAAAVTPSVAPRPTPTPVIGQLSLWHSWSQADADALAAILADFRSRYPQVELVEEFVPYDELAQRYTEAAVAGGGPDLLLAPQWWLGDLATAGVIQPLDVVAPADSMEVYWPAALDAMRWQGALYGLPTHFEVVSLLYNRTLVPPERLPATTAELLALAREKPEQAAGLYATLYHLFWGLPAFGGELLDEQGRVVLNRGSGAADFLTWLLELKQTPGAYASLDYGMLADRFKKGEFAFFVDGPWALDELAGALGENLAVTPLPAGPAGASQPWLTADGVLFNANLPAERRELALLLTQHMTSAESGGRLAAIGRRLPANRFSQIDDPLLRGFAQQGASAQAMPILPEMTQVWNYSPDLLEKVLSGVSTPAAAVIEASALINDANGK